MYLIIWEISLNVVAVVYHVLKGMASSLSLKLWDKVPTEIKNSKSLEEFKARIESCILKNCPCKICKLFIKHERLFMSHFFYYNNIDAFFVFFFFNCEDEGKQCNFIFSCYWGRHNGARIIYLLIFLLFLLQQQEETKLLWLSSWRRDFLKHF